MKSKLIVFTFTVLALTARSQIRAAEEPTPLEIAMDTMLDQVKAVKKALDPNVDLSKFPELVDKAILGQKAAKDALFLVPPFTADQPEDQQALFLASYKKSIALLIVTWIDLEVALRNKDGEGAKAAFQTLMDQKVAGHGTFQPPHP